MNAPVLKQVVVSIFSLLGVDCLLRGRGIFVLCPICREEVDGVGSVLEVSKATMPGARSAEPLMIYALGLVKMLLCCLI
jgi:hypothetical protein